MRFYTSLCLLLVLLTCTACGVTYVNPNGVQTDPTNTSPPPVSIMKFRNVLWTPLFIEFEGQRIRQQVDPGRTWYKVAKTDKDRRYTLVAFLEEGYGLDKAVVELRRTGLYDHQHEVVVDEYLMRGIWAHNGYVKNNWPQGHVIRVWNSRDHNYGFLSAGETILGVREPPGDFLLYVDVWLPGQDTSGPANHRVTQHIHINNIQNDHPGPNGELFDWFAIAEPPGRYR